MSMDSALSQLSNGRLAHRRETAKNSTQGSALAEVKKRLQLRDPNHDGAHFKALAQGLSDQSLRAMATVYKDSILTRDPQSPPPPGCVISDYNSGVEGQPPQKMLAATALNKLQVFVNYLTDNFGLRFSGNALASFVRNNLVLETDTTDSKQKIQIKNPGPPETRVFITGNSHADFANLLEAFSKFATPKMTDNSRLMLHNRTIQGAVAGLLSSTHDAMTLADKIAQLNKSVTGTVTAPISVTTPSGTATA